MLVQYAEQVSRLVNSSVTFVLKKSSSHIGGNTNVQTCHIYNLTLHNEFSVRLLATQEFKYVIYYFKELPRNYKHTNNNIYSCNKYHVIY